VVRSWDGLSKDRCNIHLVNNDGRVTSSDRQHPVSRQSIPTCFCAAKSFGINLSISRRMRSRASCGPAMLAFLKSEIRQESRGVQRICGKLGALPNCAARALSRERHESDQFDVFEIRSVRARREYPFVAVLHPTLARPAVIGSFSPRQRSGSCCELRVPQWLRHDPRSGEPPVSKWPVN